MGDRDEAVKPDCYRAVTASLNALCTLKLQKKLQKKRGTTGHTPIVMNSCLEKSLLSEDRRSNVRDQVEKRGGARIAWSYPDLGREMRVHEFFEFDFGNCAFALAD